MGKIKQMFTLVFHGHYDTATEEGRANERARSIALTALTAMLAKVFAILTPLITVRITLSYMGEEIYGLWSAVTSFFAMFSFADLGLGSGLQTELSRASALEDRSVSRRLVSSCYVILTVLTTVLVIAFAAIYPFVDWAGVLNAESEATIALAGKVVTAIVVTKVLNVPLALIQRTQLAMQEGYRTNLWQCFGNALSLIFVFVIFYMDLGVLTMIWASSLITVIVAGVNMVVYFKWQRPELRPKVSCYDKVMSRRLLNTGIMFFVLSIFTSVSLSIDNFIVAHVSSLSDVTPFSVMYKIVSMIGVVSAMLSSPMWSANGEALQRREYGWVRKATGKIAALSLLFSVICSAGVFILIRPALKILTDGAVQANYVMLFGMCLMQVFVSVTNPYFMILNGAGIVKFQIANYIVYAAISLPLKYFLGIRYGAVAISWTGAVTYVILLTLPTVYRSLLYIRKKEREK
ncbi:MAG: lipopolysaccharide biosynthesis protein [Clostridia bacterium]